MTIDRSALNTDTAQMTVFYTPDSATQTSSSETSSPAPTSSTSGDTAPSDYTPSSRTETIDMTQKSSSEILGELLRKTKAVQVEATAEELELLTKLEESRLKSSRDSELSKEVRERKKREEDLLKQARGELDATAA